MSLELVIAGYAFCILAALLGTAALVSSGHGSRKLRWLLAGQASILLALALFALRTRLPAFFGSILPNLAILFAFVLFHQAVAEIIESSRRYLGASISLLGAQLVAYWVFTFTVPDLRARIIARSVALLVQ